MKLIQIQNAVFAPDHVQGIEVVEETVSVYLLNREERLNYEFESGDEARRTAADAVQTLLAFTPTS